MRPTRVDRTTSEAGEFTGGFTSISSPLWSIVVSLTQGSIRYLATYCMQVSKLSGRQRVRSVRRRQLSVPRVLRSTFESCAFSVAGPTVWKSSCRLRTFSAGLENILIQRTLQGVSESEVLRYRPLQVDITYLLTISEHTGSQLTYNTVVVERA